MKTRMWIYEADQYGAMSDNKFYVDDPVIIPRVGEFIDCNGFGGAVGGWVTHVQYNYGYMFADESQPKQLVINVKVSEYK